MRTLPIPMARLIPTVPPRGAFRAGGYAEVTLLQTLADRTRFELSDAQWLGFQAALDQPVSVKPKLKSRLSEPGLLG